MLWRIKSLLWFIIQSLSHIWLFTTPWNAARQASLSFTISQSLVKLMSIELVMSSNHLILYRPLLLLPSIFPNIRSFPVSLLFTSGGQSLELQLQHQSFQWIFRVDFFKIDWIDLLSVQGTLKRLLQHHSSKASVHRCSAFFLVWLSHQCMIVGKPYIFV